MTVIFQGALHKMRTSIHDGIAQYTLGETTLNEHIGQDIEIEFEGAINCIACDRSIKKTYNQGYCFVCSQKLARCDLCILKPELCHIDEGTCREPQWGQEHCEIPHYVYLSYTSTIKIGITRHTQIPTRWIDQGAVSAVPIAMVPRRKTAGEFEVEISRQFADKTNWRALLTEPLEHRDFEKERDQIQNEFALPQGGQWIDAQHTTHIRYPIESYPEKKASLNLLKLPAIRTRLRGIRGQYLLLDQGGLNIRKHSGYQITVRTV